jgi:hypothetical protein
MGWILLALWVLSVLIFWSRLLGLACPASRPCNPSWCWAAARRMAGPARFCSATGYGGPTGAPAAQALIAVCGGIDWGETESEAAVMARYLMERHGISRALVLEGSAPAPS